MKRKTRMYEPWGYQDENNYQGAETILENDLESFFADAKYNKDDNKIHFQNKDGEDVGSLDVNEFVKSDSIIDHTEYANGILKIYFTNGDVITINLTELLDENEFKDGLIVDEHIVKVLIDGDSEKYISVSENGIKVAGVKADIDAEKTRAEGEEQRIESAFNAADEAILATVDNVSANVENEAQRAISAETNLQNSIELKADKETVYTQEQVDALISEKEAEITQIKKDYNNLKEIVGEIGGNVEWGVPADGTFNNMMKKNGIVKLGEDTTTSTYTGGITSANKTTLNLNGKNLTFSGTTTNNPAIMTRGKQELTIIGKGTFDAAGRIAVEANGADTVINLSGTTGFFAAEPTYVTDRSGGELIYCYLGEINIYAGVFKNNGDDKTFLLNCYDANRAAGTAKIVVYGGKFYDFNPADNTAEGEHTNFLAPGYHVETSTDGDSTVYTVKKDA